MHALHERPYIHGAFGDRLRHVSYFLSAATRQAYWDGGCDLVPNHFSEMPQPAASGARAARSCWPPPARPTAHGYFSLGHERRLRRGADRQGAVLPRGQRADAAHVRAQPDPRVAGARLVRGGPAARRGAAGARPTSATGRSPPRSSSGSPTARRCRSASAASPTPCSTALRDHRDLGIHTELLSDGIVDLVERGVVTGTRKQLRPQQGRGDVLPRHPAALRLAARQRRRRAAAGRPRQRPARGSRARTTSSRSTPRPRSTSTASARRRRSPGATGPRAAARPTSRAARCTRRAARRSSSCTRRRARAAAGSARG